jgi:methionyl-tRNA formyltransferase
MKIIFFGTPDFAVPSLELLLKNAHFEVKGVVTQPDKRRGRGKEMIPSAIKKVALKHDLPIWQPVNIKKDQDTLDQIKGFNPDAFVVVAYGQILSQKILDIPSLVCLNLHGSILPKYRGAAPIQWCLYNGERETGNTTMVMDRGMDTGAMLLTKKIPINLLDNANQLGENLAYMGADLIIDTLLKLENKEISPIPQDNIQATYAPLIQKSDYELDWSRGALQLHNQIRGFYPHCYSYFRHKQLKIIETIPLKEEYFSEFPEEYQALKLQLDNISSLEGKPSEIVAILKKWGAVIQTGSGYLLLKQVQLSGKKPQSGWDFVNGNHLQIGEFLVNS